ncbi:MAG: AAA family ATPase [Acidobacteriota bacterium]
MLLKTLSISGLYKTLTIDVTFKEDLTLLVGINGSGKTSILNVIDWLLKPHYGRLALAEYESLSLTFVENDVTHRLTATKNSESLVVSLDKPGSQFAPITFKLQPAEDEPERYLEDLYMEATPDKDEEPLWNYLRGLPKPSIITLDRTISAESEERSYLEAPAKPRAGKRSTPKSPLEFVQQVTSEKYAEFRAKSIANDDELKAHIVMSALQDPDAAFKSGGAIEPMTPREISQLEEKVATYLSTTIKSHDVRKRVHQFFKASRDLTSREPMAGKRRSLVLGFLVTQYRQIESLAKAFNDFEEKNALAFKALNEYLTCVNRFLNDSDKTLFFEQSSGKLLFSSSQGGDKRSKSVSHLSSGEKQILVLFTFLAFASGPKSVFIVDEPELSLHPKWQSEFLDEFLKLKPVGTQLLLATHSPDIVGKYKKYCTPLRGKTRE